MSKNFEITKELAKRVLDTVDAGLVSGMGVPIPGQMCVEAAVCFAMGLPHSDEPTCVSPALRQLKITLNDASGWSSNESRAKGLRRLALAQLGSAGVLDEKVFAQEVALMTVRTVVADALDHAASVHPDEHHRQALRCAAENCRSGRDAAYAAYAAAAIYADAADAAADAAGAYAADAVYAAAAAARAYAADAAADAIYADAAAARAYAADAAAYAAAAADAAAARAYAEKVLSDFAENVVQILIKMNAPGCAWLHLTE